MTWRYGFSFFPSWYSPLTGRIILLSSGHSYILHSFSLHRLFVPFPFSTIPGLHSQGFSIVQSVKRTPSNVNLFLNNGIHLRFCILVAKSNLWNSNWSKIFKFLNVSTSFTLNAPYHPLHSFRVKAINMEAGLKGTVWLVQFNLKMLAGFY